MIKLEFIGGEEVAQKLQSISPAVHGNLVRAITKLSIQLQAKVQSEKLSGQVLKNRTGTLRRSINYKIDESADRVTGRVGTNLKYGLAHEFGFHGAVNVKAHLRMIKQAFGKPIAPKQVMVSAHSRTMNLPERSFLRTALREMIPEIQATIDQAVKV